MNSSSRTAKSLIGCWLMPQNPVQALAALADDPVAALLAARRVGQAAQPLLPPARRAAPGGRRRSTAPDRRPGPYSACAGALAAAWSLVQVRDVLLVDRGKLKAGQCSRSPLRGGEVGYRQVLVEQRTQQALGSAAPPNRSAGRRRRGALGGGQVAQIPDQLLGAADAARVT